MGSCDLCDLPTPSPPIRDEDGNGVFCCQGCMRVASTVDEMDELDVEQVRQSTEGSTAVPTDAETAYFSVTGMHCTTCEAFLRSRGDQIEGIYDVDVNYGLQAARIQYDPTVISEPELTDRVSGFGYEFRTRSTDTPLQTGSGTADRMQRAVVGGFLTMLIMPWYFFYLYPQYLGLGGGLLEAGRTTAVGIYFPLVVIAIMTTIVLGYTGYPILRGAWISLRTGRPNTDLLVSIAIVAAYLYSLVALAIGRTHLYFDVTVMVIMVVTIGRIYENRLRTDATELLRSITKSQPEDATRLTNADRERVPRSALTSGDRLLIKPGERIPMDGTINTGTATIDESLLTGESFPHTRTPGDHVIGGSVVMDGPITVTVGPDPTSTLDKVASSMWEIQSEQPGTQRLVDALATIFVPFVLTIGLVVAVWRLSIGDTVSGAMLAGLTVLVVSCPCAMGLATPLAFAGGLRDALREQLVITNPSVFERAPQAETIIFDKTGTLTSGELSVEDSHGHPETLKRAAQVESVANQPIADAIVKAAEETVEKPVMQPDGGRHLSPGEHTAEQGSGRDQSSISGFQRHPGAGVSGIVDGDRVFVGAPAFIRQQCGRIPPTLTEHIARLDRSDGRPIVVGWGDAPKGVIAITDATRRTWRRVLDQFDDRVVVILTGDDSTSVDRFDRHPAVDHVFSGVPPDGKTETVKQFRRNGTTVMVGDGTNDAPALAAADLGIAMGSGTAAASDAADVVIVDNKLERIEHVFSIASGTRRRIRENIGWALLYNAIAIPLAVVGLINPFFAAVAMSASSVLVVSNSKRTVNRNH